MDPFFLLVIYESHVNHIELVSVRGATADAVKQRHPNIEHQSMLFYENGEIS